MLRACAVATIALLTVLGPEPAWAQRGSPAPVGVRQPVDVRLSALSAAHAGQPADFLPVTDDAGHVITEAEIASRLRPRRTVLLVALSALGGIVLGEAMRPRPPTPAPGYDECSPYNPCSPREAFYRENLWWAGAVVGGMIGLAIPTGVDRLQAVAIIRRERAAARASAPQ